MNDYSKMIENIKLSEIRVAAVTKEIKEYEAEMKRLNEEIDVIKTKEKQINEELEYKRKTVNEKEWETQSLKRQYDTWKHILNEKQEILNAQNDELDSLEKKVWNTRRDFHGKTLEFLDKYDFLSNGNLKFETLIRKQEEKKSLLNSIEMLDKTVSGIEKEHSDLKANWDLMQHLEKDRDNLIDYEQSSEVFRLDNKISRYTKELEMLEKELYKYCERAIMKPYSAVVAQNFHQASAAAIQNEEIVEHGSTYQENRPMFVPKKPSFLIKRPSSINDIN